MHLAPIFNPRDEQYKAPYGAAARGTTIRFTLRPPRRDGYARGILTARFEADKNRTETVPLVWRGLDGARDLFCGNLETKGYTGLLWYSFALTRPDGQRKILGEYRVTVYDPSHPVPSWFGEGLTYQIFPDRFFRTPIPLGPTRTGERFLHKNWDETPVYLPNEYGEIRNRDFFGGNLPGIIEKLPYLSKLGVETIYLNPIFEAAENHRYGVADYESIDPYLGTMEDFQALCAHAHRRGIRILLDGVFNHTGFVSRYFNGTGCYPDLGASQSKDSPYYDWFSFTHFPEQFSAWWGIYSLPSVNETTPSYRDYIFGDKNSIVRRYLRAGCDGFRLDVADELPDDFIAALRAAIREENPSAVLIGEVWEDGSSKIAYDVRRRHLLGGHLDGLTNYPFRSALFAYLLGGDAALFYEEMESLREHYPKSAFYSAMNLIGTHDTARALTALGTHRETDVQTRTQRAEHRLSAQARAAALARLKLAALVLYAFPGSPCLYYGDEAGMEGFEDPFNRRTFPWGCEDAELQSWFVRLGQARRSLPPLRTGTLHFIEARGALLAFSRTCGNKTVLCAVNAGDSKESLSLPWTPKIAFDFLAQAHIPKKSDEMLPVALPPKSGALICSFKIPPF